MALRLEHVSYTYSADTPWAVTAINDVSFAVEQGEVVGIVGHTGSGKSSLAQLICGLIPADSGQIWLNDLQIVGVKKLKAVELVKRVGMVFQYPEHQLFEETVAAEISYGPTNLGWSPEQVKQGVFDIADMLGMPAEFLSRNPLQLSGGEKRKVTLASVLVMNPKILVLDEPFVGLDSVARQDFIATLLAWQKEHQATILCISHDMDQLAAFCQRLLVMQGGRLILDAPIQQAFAEQEILAKAGILLPVAKQLLLALQQHGWQLNVLPLTPAEAVQEIMAYCRREAGDDDGH